MGGERRKKEKKGSQTKIVQPLSTHAAPEEKGRDSVSNNTEK